MNSSSSKYLLVIILLILAFAAGFFSGKNIANNPQMASKQAGSTKAPQPNSIFKMQQAFIQGTITKVDGQIVTVKNDQGVSSAFPASKRISIYQSSPNSKQSTASSDLKIISIGIPALVSLELVNGEYQITSISYTSSAIERGKI